mgnify:CR=1 FL=1
MNLDKLVSGIVLAAGKSERMGSSKALLPIFGTTFLKHILNQIQSSRLFETKVVLGHQSNEILKRLPEISSVVVINEEYEKGQLSSLQKAILAIYDGPSEGLMLFLVDHPLVQLELINGMVRAFSNGKSPIVIPSFEGKRGHPVIFPRELFSDLLAAPQNQGAVGVVREHSKKILHLEWKSEVILADVDTPQDYSRFVQQRTSRG